jgi:signal peptidase II
MKNRYKVLLFCLSALVFIGCDRLTKDLARTHLEGKGEFSYLHGTVKLIYVENTGAFLSFGDQLPKTLSFWLLSILPLFALLALFVYTIKNAFRMSFLQLFSFALIISGGLGNIIDRIAFDRHVTDFMNLGINDLRTGIFNVADVCVTSGMIGLLILSFKSKKEHTISE